MHSNLNEIMKETSFIVIPGRIAPLFVDYWRPVRIVNFEGSLRKKERFLLISCFRVHGERCLLYTSDAADELLV